MTDQTNAAETATEQTEEATQETGRTVNPAVAEARAKRKEERAQQRADQLAARTKTFGQGEEDVTATQDKMFGVLMSAKAKTASSLNDTEKAALALMHVCKRGVSMAWKPFNAAYNSKLKPEVYDAMYCSLMSDPSYEIRVLGKESAGFNLRKQLHLAQGGRRGAKYENHPLRLTSGTVVANTRPHAEDIAKGNTEPRNRLLDFTLPTSVFDMLEENSELVTELTEKYFVAE